MGERKAGRRAGSLIFFSGRLGGHLATALAEDLGEGCGLAHGEDFAGHKEWASRRPATTIWSSSSWTQRPESRRTPILRAALQRRSSEIYIERHDLARLHSPKGGFGLSHSSPSWSGDKSATNPLG